MYNEDFVKRIKEIRKSSGKTIREITDGSAMKSAPELCRFENGKINATIPKIIDYLRFYGMGLYCDDNLMKDATFVPKYIQYLMDKNGVTAHWIFKRSLVSETSLKHILEGTGTCRCDTFIRVMNLFEVEITIKKIKDEA